MAFFLNDAILSLISTPLTICVFACIIATPLISCACQFATKQRPVRGIPILSLHGQTPEESWYKRPRELLSKGRKLYPHEPFQVLSYGGPKLVLPQRYLEEIRDAPNVAFAPYISSAMPWDMAGFDSLFAMHKHQVVLADVVRVKLTQSLGLITESLVDESIQVTDELFGKLAPGQWHNVQVLAQTTKIIARLTARTLLGEEVAHDPEYVDITAQHGRVVLSAALQLRRWPRYLWRMIQYLIPACAKVRSQVRKARKLITSEIERRRNLARAAIAAGQRVPKTHDSVAWVLGQNKVNEKIDLVGFQLAVSAAAIHNTGAQLFAALWYVVAHPKYIQLLREEAIAVLKEHGWTRQALARLRLQDAVHKECLRIVRCSLATVRRQVVKGELKFSDGFAIPEGRNFFVIPPADYQGEDEQFHPERWVGKGEEEEEEGQVQKHAFVAANIDNQEFGVGKHACPGRWFANDEIKIAFSILLLCYDWKAAPDMQMPFFAACEDLPIFVNTVQVQMRVREPEINLASPEYKARNIVATGSFQT